MMDKIIQDYENGIRLIQAYNKGLLEKIGQLEREWDGVRQERDGLSIMLTAAESAFETIKRERDALMNDVSGYCSTCAFVGDCAKHDLNDSAPFSRWFYGDCEEWQWHGVQEEKP